MEQTTPGGSRLKRVGEGHMCCRDEFELIASNCNCEASFKKVQRWSSNAVEFGSVERVERSVDGLTVDL